MDPASQGFALADFWSLVEQAGPLRWPIFVVLALGLIQIFLKLYELLWDRVASRTLSGVDFATADLDEVGSLLGRQDASMLARLQSALLNVAQTRQSAATLHGEVAHFLNSERDQFGVFRRRMEFLSDTAGALGLMGTVWGMFTVFFQGTSEQELILRGMGVALITTLLGLVVSIVLNFSATELSTLFEARLDWVARKADVLRFRLLEVAPTGEGALALAGPAVAESGRQVDASVTASELRHSVATGAGSARSAPWCYVDVNGAPRQAIAGESIDDLAVVVRDGEGAPLPNMPVVARVHGVGSLNGDGRRAHRTSDDRGRVELSCIAPERIGPFAVEVLLPDQAAPPVRLDIDVRPAAPDRFFPEGNFQAAVAGARLASPFGVRVADRFGNPVPEVPVRFAVKSGNGSLGGGSKERQAVTDESGLAAVPFTVADQPGTNVVTAVLPQGETLEFTALGTQA